MTGTLRIATDDETFSYILTGRQAPIYHEDTNTLFSIKIHHSGTMDFDNNSYLGGLVNYFDFCDFREMNLNELHSMAKQICHGNCLRFYYSSNSSTDCNNFILMVQDEDARNLINFVDSERVVVIYIESEVHNQVYREGQYHQVDMIGDNEDTDEDGDSDQLTDGDDSVFSDGFQDSDFEYDDVLYDENIDQEIEWVSDVMGESSDLLDISKKPKEHFMFLSNKKSSKQEASSRYHVYRGDADQSDFEFEVGLCFNTATDFRDAIRRYSTKQGKPVRFTKNCSDKIQVTCDCGWVIYASFISKNDRTFRIKSIKGEHTCYRTSSSKHCSSKFLAKKYERHLRGNPEWPVNSMQEIMSHENQTSLSIWKMYRAKKHAEKLSYGTELEQYANLWRYCEEIYQTNPGTTIKIKAKHVPGSETCQFKRLYICWGALKKGFKAGCRPVIGLDGTHLKTSRGGVLLCAIGIDGNNSMYPIAYAMVSKENKKSWEWFVSLLIQDLSIDNSYAWTIISDKQKGLIKAIEDLLPHCEHRFCLRHMYNNFKSKHKGLQLKDLLWRAASATRVLEFHNEMEKLKACDRSAYDWVKEKPPMHWAKSHFSTWPKCDLLLNNLCESFNSVILKARNKPIITMLEIIRVILMKRIHAQRDKVLKSNDKICPAVQKMLEKNKKNVHQYILEWNGHDKFEVTGWLGDKWIVNLTEKMCSCRKWELSGIPCVHATACIFYRRETVEDYVEHWFQKDTFLKAYSNFLDPIKGPREWPDTTSIPLVPWLEKPKKIGRPPKHARKKEPEEVEKEKVVQKKNSVRYSCSNCREVGHNKKGCKQPVMNKEVVNSTTSKKRSKLQVNKSVGQTHSAGSGFESTTQVVSAEISTSVVATRIYRMNSNALVTQQSDGHSTVTKFYN